MKKLLTFLLAFSFTSFAEASSIDGIYLKKLIGKWLESNGQKSNVEILDDIKYADCDENDIFIKDISGLFRLLKVSCLGPNKWTFITRNKQDNKLSKIKKRNNMIVLDWPVNDVDNLATLQRADKSEGEWMWLDVPEDNISFDGDVRIFTENMTNKVGFYRLIRK